MSQAVRKVQVPFGDITDFRPAMRGNERAVRDGRLYLVLCNIVLEATGERLRNTYG